MDKNLQKSLIEYRIALLSSRNKANYNIIRKLQRKLRNI